jgi:Flp pilus assembly CpaE family ATPase
MADDRLGVIAPSPSPNGTGPATVRVLLAVSEPERERRLIATLASGGLMLAGRCLDAATLVEQAHGAADVALVTATLHRLTPATALAVREAGLPLLLLADPPLAERYAGLAEILPVDMPPDDLRVALVAAAGRGPAGTAGSRHPRDRAPRGMSSEPSLFPVREGRVIALVGGKGSPGVTTLAVALADALATRRRTVLLVDADLRLGSVGAHLDLDPRRGLFTLAYGTRGGPEEWVRRLDEEVQDGPGFLVLGGIERPLQRAQVSEEVIAAALAAARTRFAEVVVDAGAVMAGLTVLASEAALRRADRVLLVTVPDLAGLWHARTARDLLVDALGVPTDRLTLVLNRRRGRAHRPPEEVARAFGLPVLGVIPDDVRAADRAMDEQLPLTRVRRRGAARAVRRFATALTSDVRPTVQDRAGRGRSGDRVIFGWWRRRHR